MARDLAAALGWSGDLGAAALATRLPEHVPCGSTAKLAAVGRGDVPPGADPDELSRRLLGYLVDRAGAPAGGAPSPSWSCWVTATVTAALFDAADLGPVRVAATRRIDDRAPEVDLHAAVLVGGGAGTVLCDPYFGLAVDVPAEPGATTEAVHAAGVASVARTAAGERWELAVALRTWSDDLRYRLLAPDLDRDDVRAMCAISVPLSGVPSRPYARLHRAGTILDVRVDETGAGLVGEARPAGEAMSTTHPGWEAAVADFAVRTGVRIT